MEVSKIQYLLNEAFPAVHFIAAEGDILKFEYENLSHPNDRGTLFVNTALASTEEEAIRLVEEKRVCIGQYKDEYIVMLVEFLYENLEEIDTETTEIGSYENLESALKKALSMKVAFNGVVEMI